MMREMRRVVERCLVCLLPLEGEAAREMHAKCTRWLFGKVTVPALTLDPANLYLFGQQMAGKITISGVQSKVALGWSGKTLRVAAADSAFILKPQVNTYPELPQNEHVSMLLARKAGIETARTGLVRLSDGSLALLVRRFDRSDGRRIPMEDFCQLAELLPRDKYRGSAELCARIVEDHSAEPGIDRLRLFRQVLFSWWIGNGDLHLKNLALITQEKAVPRLSPAFDLLSTAVVIPNDTLALPVLGKRDKIGRADWVAFAEYCELPMKLAERELTKMAEVLTDALALLDHSFLRPDLRDAFAAILHERTKTLSNA